MNTSTASASPSSHSAPEIEFWFEFASNYSYLSAMRIEQEAARRGVAVRWKPFLLGPIFQSLGWRTSPFVLQQAKGDYVWHDMVRQCRKYGLPWTRPSTFPRNALLPLRVALLGSDAPWIGAFCRAVMTLNFAEDRDVNDPVLVAGLLESLGLPAQVILQAALADANKTALRVQTEAAQKRGIFGAPTFFVDSEMFWGNDRLDDALALCAPRAER